MNYITLTIHQLHLGANTLVTSAWSYDFHIAPSTFAETLDALDFHVTQFIKGASNPIAVSAEARTFGDDPAIGGGIDIDFFILGLYTDLLDGIDSFRIREIRQKELAHGRTGKRFGAPRLHE